MGLFVNTNVSSLNAQRNLGHSSRGLATSIERISSGLRINSAGDDAAGLAISERFHSQIRGLSRAMRNANDAISLTQVAEGALQETTDILQRIRELSVQAANDVNTDSDRQAVQDEVDQLVDELNRIGDTTTFNRRNLLDGSFNDAFFHVGAFARETVRLSLRDARASSIGRHAGATGAAVSDDALVNGDVIVNGVTIRATQATDDTLSTSLATASAVAKASAINDSSEFHGVTARALPTQLTGVARMQGGQLDGDNYLVLNGVVITDFDVGPDDAGHELTRAINEHSGDTGVIASHGINGALVLTAEDGRNIDLRAVGNAAQIAGVPPVLVQTASIHLTSDEDIVLSGANEAWTGFGDDQRVAVSDVDAVSTIDLRSRQGANTAIEIIDRAIQDINDDRVQVGAVANRLQTTLDTLANSVERSTAARSQIIDADFAHETAQLSRYQILVQAGTSILGQANSQPQAALSLLQG